MTVEDDGNWDSIACNRKAQVDCLFSLQWKSRGYSSGSMQIVSDGAGAHMPELHEEVIMFYF